MNETAKVWLKRIGIGGLCGVALALLITLLLNFLLNSISILGSTPDYTNICLTFDRCAAYFGSVGAAVAVEWTAVFALGGAVGIATLPFDEERGRLALLSLAHFVVTGALSLAVGWAYGWFGLGPAGPGMVVTLYTLIYAAVWAVRWAVWYRELLRLRRALGLDDRKGRG